MSEIVGVTRIGPPLSVAVEYTWLGFVSRICFGWFEWCGYAAGFLGELGEGPEVEADDWASVVVAGYDYEPGFPFFFRLVFRLENPFAEDGWSWA